MIVKEWSDCDMKGSEIMQQQNRIHQIDVMRGIAIFGILLVNMAHFSYPDLYLQMIDSDNFLKETWGKIDQLTVTFLDIFVQMKFITLFSFLFGFGMIIMMERTEAKGEKVLPVLFRRLLALFTFGMIHAFLIWDGDVLTDYAILGFILLIFIKRRPKTLLIWSIVLYAMFAIPLVLATVIPIEETPETIQWQIEMEAESEQNAKQAIQIYSSGTFLDIQKQRFHDRMYYMSMNGMATLNPLIYFFSNIPYFTMFLLGAYVAKRKILHEPKKHQSLLIKIWIIGLLIGVPSNILFGFFHNDLLLLLGAPFLMLFYLVSIVLLFQIKWSQKLLMPFAAVGRTAFTNYMMQLIIATTIFYHYGLGLYGKITPFYGL